MNRGFKLQTIKNILRKKIRNWMATLPEELQPVAKNNTLICGGAITSLLMGETPNDYDVYFKRKSATKVFANHYVDVFNKTNNLTSVNNYRPMVEEKEIVNIKGELEERIRIRNKSAGIAVEGQTAYRYFENQSTDVLETFFDSVTQNPIECIEEIAVELHDKKKEKYRPVFLSDNAITLSDKMQLVIRFYGDVEDIHKNFDFVHCMCAYDHEKDELFVPQEALESILSRALIYKGSLYPVASVFRVRKFIERGWRITAGQLLKMIWQINELDLKDMETLNEQLIGVDRAYMHELMIHIKDTPQSKIDSIYIAKLIDEIFEG
jgi:hypothetical protein